MKEMRVSLDGAHEVSADRKFFFQVNGPRSLNQSRFTPNTIHIFTTRHVFSKFCASPSFLPFNRILRCKSQIPEGSYLSDFRGKIKVSYWAHSATQSSTLSPISDPISSNSAILESVSTSSKSALFKLERPWKFLLAP